MECHFTGEVELQFLTIALFMIMVIDSYILDVTYLKNLKFV